MTEPRRLLQHFLAAIAYRTQKALRDAPDSFPHFRAAPNVRTPSELVWHMTSVIGYARTMLRGGTFDPPALPTFAAEVDRFHATLEGLREDFEDPGLTATITDQQFLQGPLADAMTHAGQLAMLRRLAGSPVASENFIFARIDAANLGTAQAAPAAPDSWWRPDLPPLARPPRNVEARSATVTATGPPRIAAVVLAAGGSARMGQPKQLILHDGKPLIALAAEAAVRAGAARVVVVLGAHEQEVRAALPPSPQIETVVNPDWASGLASSLVAGVRAALEDGACEGVLVTLADQPLVDAAALRPLIDAFHGGARIVASSYAGGAPGVPALFGREHVQTLLSLTGDAGAASWLKSRSREVTTIALGEAALDIDTPADAARLAGQSRLR